MGIYDGSYYLFIRRGYCFVGHHLYSSRIRWIPYPFSAGFDLTRMETVVGNDQIVVGSFKILSLQLPIGFRAPGFRRNPIVLCQFLSESDLFRSNPVMDPIGTD